MIILKPVTQGEGLEMKMEDIARLAGVSKATVSRVINSPEQVSPQLAARVEQVLQETGYAPNLLARELVTKQTHLVGVVVPQIGIDTFAEMIEGITHVLNQSGYNLLLATSRDHPEEEIRYFNVFRKKQVDGIISFPTVLLEEHQTFFARGDMPFVLVSQADPGGRVPGVLYDDFNGTRDMVEYLLELGHRRIAYLGVGSHNKTIDQARRAGYLAALEKYKVAVDEDLMMQGDFTLQYGYQGMKEIWERTSNKPTAVFAATDRLALAAIKYLREQGCKVPEDVSVAGVDDMDIAATVEPSLTTVHYDYYDSGVQAAKLLLQRIKRPQEKFSDLMIGYQRKERGSTALLKKLEVLKCTKK